MEAIVTLPDGRKAKVTGADQAAILRAVETLKGGAPQPQTSPFPVPPAPSFSGGVPAGPFAPPPLQFGGGADQYSPEQRQAAATGVDVDTGSDIDRSSLGLAPNESFKNAFAQDLLTKRYGKKVQVRVGPESKETEFLSPKTNRWTTIDEAGFSKGDLKDMFGPGLVTGGATLGATAGLAATPVAGAAGAGVGAFIGELYRLQEGKKRGVHNLSDEDMLKAASRVGGGEAAFSYGAEKLLHLGQLAKRFFSPRPLAQQEASELLAKLDAGLGKGTGANLTLPQQAGDVALQGELDVAARSDPSLINREVRRESENRSAIDGWYQATFQPSQQAARNTGAQLKGAVEQSNASAVERTVRQTQALETPIKGAVEALPIYNEGGFGNQARETVKAHWDDLTNKKNAAWDKYEEVIGHTTSESGRTTTKYQLAFTPGPGTKKALDAAERGLFAGEKAEAASAIPKVKEGGKIDLADLNRSIRWIRQRVRNQESGTVTSDLGTYNLKQVEKDLVKARAEFLAKTDPAALKALEDAEDASRLRGQFEKATLGQWLRKDGDAYVMSNYQVFRELFLSRDVQAAQEMGSLVANDPQKRLAMQNSVWALYRDLATDGGVPKPSLHEKFLDKYGDMAKAFFSPEDYKKIKQFGGFAEVIENNAQVTTAYIKGLKDRLSRKLVDGSPESTLDFVLSKDASLTDIRQMRRLMGASGALPEDTAKGLGERIWRRTTNEAGEFDLAKLKGLLKTNSEQITEFTGSSQYVANLRALASDLEKLGMKGEAASRKMSLYQRLTRIIFRPLSREGLARTAAMETIYRPREAAVMYEILTNKDALAEYVRLGKQQASERKVFQFLASVGGASLLGEE